MGWDKTVMNLIPSTLQISIEFATRVATHAYEGWFPGIQHSLKTKQESQFRD